MLRDLEDTIVSKTQAESISHPLNEMGIFFGHGSRYAPVRKIIPKRQFSCKADVLWVPLMGPEDFQLDLFSGWYKLAKRKILYLFDTFPHQFQLIKQIVKRYNWDFLITPFRDAIEPLSRITQRKWHCVPHGVSLSRFYPRQWQGEKLPPIFISSYGRRLNSYHDEIRKWCVTHQRWYNYTVTDISRLSVPTQDNYQCLANHLGSSLFSVCWPVEIASPSRAAGLSPITCRWFESAASGAVIVGRPPKVPVFEQLFGKDAVYPVPEKPEDVPFWLDGLQERAWDLRAKALIRLSQYKEQWSWENRVQAVIDLLK